MTIPLRQLDKDNYAVLRKAAATDDLALMSMVRKCDGADVAVLCTAYRISGGREFIPLAVMVEGDAYDTFHEPCEEMDSLEYTLCKHCDHFVDKNDTPEPEEGVTFAEWTHLDSGEKDHEAEPGNMTMSLLDWKRKRPDLFVKFPDGYIGPNSEYFTV